MWVCAFTPPSQSSSNQEFASKNNLGYTTYTLSAVMFSEFYQFVHHKLLQQIQK